MVIICYMQSIYNSIPETKHVYSVYSNEATLFLQFKVYVTLFPIILINNQLDAQFFFLYVYFNSVHVSSILDGHLHRVTYTRCRIGITDSPGDKYGVARNM